MTSEYGGDDFLTLLGRDRDWHVHAACADSGIDFYQEVGGNRQPGGRHR